MMKVQMFELSWEIMSRAAPNFFDQGGIAKSADLGQRAECTDGQSLCLLCSLDPFSTKAARSSSAQVSRLKLSPAQPMTAESIRIAFTCYY